LALELCSLGRKTPEEGERAGDDEKEFSLGAEGKQGIREVEEGSSKEGKEFL